MDLECMGSIGSQARRDFIVVQSRSEREEVVDEDMAFLIYSTRVEWGEPDMARNLASKQERMAKIATARPARQQVLRRHFSSGPALQVRLQHEVT